MTGPGSSSSTGGAPLETSNRAHGSDEFFWSQGALDASLIVIDDPQREFSTTNISGVTQLTTQSPLSSPSSGRSVPTPRSSSAPTSKVSGNGTCPSDQGLSLPIVTHSTA